MKKIIVVLGLILLLGCENIMNTPTSKVESFFHKYQMLDKNVLSDMDKVINKDKSLNKKQKEIYKEILERQYQNLSYKIKSEEIENNTAIVEVEIEVLDYKSIKKTDKLNNYLKKLKQVKDKTKYQLTFYLNKEKGVWKMEELSLEDYKKINGL